MNVKYLYNLIYGSLGKYPAPSNLTYWWNFGIYALICLGIQIISGIFLAMYYISDQSLAFYSIEYMMRNVNLGWLIRYIHANGASFSFLVVYIHIFRGLYHGSFIYPRHSLWNSGILILILMIVTAFLGYVLPWGQMSFWAATVITNPVSAFPLIGTDIVIWLWGGYSVGNATLTRFYSLHYLLPFIIIGLVGIHLILLHNVNSNNPLGISFKNIDYSSMYPYYIYKDLLGVLIFVNIYTLFVFFIPNVLGHTDNYIMADPMVTPIHIVPEWYFSPFYAILRSIPDKLFGVIFMFLALILLLILPFIINNDKYFLSLNFKFCSRTGFWFFLSICILLGWIGSSPAETPYIEFGQSLTFFYFIHLVFLINLLNKLDLYIYNIYIYNA